MTKILPNARFIAIMQCSVCNVFQWGKSARDGQRLHETLVPYTMYFNGIFFTEQSCDVL